MSMFFTVRRATVPDAALLAAFAARTFYEAFAADVPVDAMTRYLAESFDPDLVANELADENSVFLVAEGGDKQFAGYARLYFGNTLPEIQGPAPVKLWRLYTACEWQGKGVGKALVLEAIKVAAERDGKTLWLTVNQGNDKAIPFYERNGFRKTGTTTFNLGGEIHHDFVMEFSLTPSPSLIRMKEGRTES